MRLHYLAIAVDLAWVALSAVFAVLIRDNFVPWEQHLNAVTAYAVIAVFISAIVFSIAEIHKRLWRYTALPDVIRIIAAVTVAILLAVFVSFVDSRLEGVARSVPVIQWFLLVGAMVGTRVAMRLWYQHKRQHEPPQSDAPAGVENVVIVGVSHITELFLESVAEYASKTISVVGILSEQRDLRGRLLRFQKVLGSPKDLPQVLADLEIHGVSVDRIVVAQPFEELSANARDALAEIETSSSVKVDWMSELLGLTGGQVGRPRPDGIRQGERFQSVLSTEMVQGLSPAYRRLKRTFDVCGAITLSIVLSPLIGVVALVVAIDVGVPVVFWQQRPGRLGRPFKLYKFCTMRAAHDVDGTRIADEQRSSAAGRFLRRTRIDEIPQLYNILIGEMSFVGPRPLLPSDQPTESYLRSLVRPGLTGMAQVYGARDISAEDKNALDVWYVQHASMTLDLKILLKTSLVILRGERVDRLALQAARKRWNRLLDKDATAGQTKPNSAAGEAQAARATV